MKPEIILLPVDVARCPLEVFELVNGLAKRSEVTVILLHVLNLNILAPENRVYEELGQEAQWYLESLANQHLHPMASAITHVRVGMPAEEAFDVGLPLEEDRSRPGFMRPVKKGGRPAATSFRVLEQFKGFAWIECRPATNRPHQIRVHLAASGLPVLNDDRYGNETRLLLSALKRGYKGRDTERPLIRRLAMHASELTVTHPLTRERLTLRAPVRDDLGVALNHLRRFGAVRCKPGLPE